MANCKDVSFVCKIKNTSFQAGETLKIVRNILILIIKKRHYFAAKPTLNEKAKHHRQIR